MIASWLSGTLSAIWGPQRVMQLGAAIWVVFETIFLLFAVNSGSLVLVATIYGIRGLSYPLFAFGFLVWVQTVTRVELMRGSAAGWFWFAFTGGLPTLGALVAAVSTPLMGVYNTFWLSLVIVAIGGLIGSFAVHEAQGKRPIADEHVENPRSYRGSWKASTSCGATPGCPWAASCPHRQHLAPVRVLLLHAVRLRGRDQRQRLHERGTIRHPV